MEGRTTRDSWRFSRGDDRAASGDVVESMRLPRSMALVIFLVVFLCFFMWPYSFSFEWFDGADDDSLFSLVFRLFGLFFFLGWSIPVLGLLAALLFALFGRERLHARRGELVVKIGLFGLGFERRVRASTVGGWYYDVPEAQSPHHWRGSHLVFEIKDDAQLRFGGHLTESHAGRLASRVCERLKRPNRELPAAERAPVVEPKTREALAKFKRERARAPAVPVARRTESAKSDAGIISPLALVVANVVPILGVMFLDWRVGEIMLVFWAESAVVAFWNVCKMVRIGGWATLAAGPFFIFHFGAFMAGHLLFIYGFFVADQLGEVDVTVSRVISDFSTLSIAVLALFVSHGVSFFANFLGKREYEGRTLKEQMMEPYTRILVMHLTIIFGGFLVMMFENVLPALMLLIVLKVVADVRAHLKEHESGRAAAT